MEKRELTKEHLTFKTKLVPTSEFREIDNKKYNVYRLSIFHAGLNKNRLIFTDEVSKQLLSTLPYTPVVGEYSEAMEDFTEHTQGTVPYGVVPENPNLTEVQIVEDDGTVNTYFTTDVYIWNKVMEHSDKIVNKQHSMELDPETITGEWSKDSYGDYVFTPNHAEFLKLTILGDSVTPCFKKSAFFKDGEEPFELVNFTEEKIKSIFKAMFEEEKNKDSKDKGGEQPMAFEYVSQNDTAKLIFSQLNGIKEDATEISVKFSLVSVGEDSFIAVDNSTGKSAKYTFKLENEVLTIGEPQEITVSAFTKEELEAQEEAKKEAEKTATDFAAAQATIETLEGEKATLETKVSEVEGKFTAAQAENEKLLKENSELEDQRKVDIKAKFTKLLGEEAVEEIVPDLTKFSSKELLVKFSEAVANQVMSTETPEAFMTNFTKFTPSVTKEPWEELESVKKHALSE